MSTTNTAQSVRGTDTPKKADMGAFTTASAMAMLWSKASRNMGLHELEWLADGAAEQVGTNAQSLGSVLMTIGCFAQADADVGLLDADNTAALLFNIHQQVDTIAGLAHIAADAGFLARRCWKDGAA